MSQLRRSVVLSSAALLFVLGSARCALDRLEVEPGSHVPADAGSDACRPKTCAELAVVCGSVDDGCGSSIACGECSTGSCIAGACELPAACTNGAKDDGEQEVDCGGSCPPCGCAREGWQSLPTQDAPTPRGSAYSAWTGREVLVWGGLTESSVLGDGARFDPGANAWSAISGSGAPAPRSDDGDGVWTGRELLIWGGRSGSTAQGDGARYDPASDSWATIAAAGAPSPRFAAVQVWTGRELFVWGGSDGGKELGDGFRYDPRTDQWSSLPTKDAPSARRRPAALWTGRELVIWGGESAGAALADGARFDPKTGAWSALPKAGAPSPRHSARALWTGREVLILAGETTLGGASGAAAYDPEANTWRALPSAFSPSARSGASIAWTGREALVWGGDQAQGGARYDARRDTWTTMAAKQAPAARARAVATWTGRELFVWGGVGQADGARYTPPADLDCDHWLPMATSGAPTPRSGHRAGWTGREVIFVGGTETSGCSGVTNTGASYDPIADKWSPIPDFDAAMKRQVMVVAFTGRDLVAWGGTNKGCSGYHSGLVFDVRARTWSATPETDAPIAGDQGADVSSAWAFTGRELAVFAPNEWTEDDHHLYLYDHEGPAWAFADPAGEPSQRGGASTVWTGREVIVWGGNRETTFGDGARFDLTTKKWQPVSATGAPAKRTWHSAVWTGREMIVWGGVGDQTDPANTWLAQGARYDPRTDSWKPVSTIGEPSARSHQLALWTGREMIIWSGQNKSGILADGARYDPDADRWWPIADSGSPPRMEFPAIWTGREVIAWGGSAKAGLVGSGGRYVP